MEELVGDDFSVKLDVLRGLQDHFYFALRDDGAASDSLHVLKFHYNDDTREFEIKNEPIPAAYTGEILAFEMDSSITNDVESFYHDNSNLEEWQDKFDRIYLIDGRLNLFKFQIERECNTLDKVLLTKFSNVQDQVEENIRNKDFIRISVTDRCLTIKGKTLNYRTGFEWDFMANFSESQSIPAVMSENVPFTNLQIALFRDEKKEAFLIKNEPGSRKRITFAHRQRDVLLFEMINCNLMLAKMKGQEGLENNYWTLIDAFGNIQAIPQKMKEILELRNWTKI